MREEREKMIGKAVLYAENMEAGNRNGYMTHKYAASVIKGIAEDYKQEISKILEQQEKTKQDKSEGNDSDWNCEYFDNQGLASRGS